MTDSSKDAQTAVERHTKYAQTTMFYSVLEDFTRYGEREGIHVKFDTYGNAKRASNTVISKINTDYGFFYTKDLDVEVFISEEGR